MQSRNFWLSREVILGLAFAVLLTVPVIVFGGAKNIYVDKNASGSEDGTSSHPYHTISKALDHAKDGVVVRVKKGTYKEHITLPKGVELRSDAFKRDAVVIEGNDNNPTVVMKNGTKLSKVTINGGRHGIRVDENAKANIIGVLVKNSDRDGIHIDAANKQDKKHMVYIEESEIRNSHRAGIYAEKHYVVIVDSDVVSNGSDGVDLSAAGTKAWLESNRLSNNKGSGAKFVLDGASIYGKKNSIRNNKREGVEVNASGAAGTIELKKTAFVSNNRYGVAQVARTNSGARMFGNLSYGIGANASRFESNTLGSVSPIIRGY